MGEGKGFRKARRRKCENAHELRYAGKGNTPPPSKIWVVYDTSETMFLGLLMEVLIYEPSTNTDNRDS